MITDCKCPYCGKEEAEFYDYDIDIGFSDDDTFYRDYMIHCDCGEKYTYTEWFKLTDTQISEGWNSC